MKMNFSEFQGDLVRATGTESQALAARVDEKITLDIHKMKVYVKEEPRPIRNILHDDLVGNVLIKG